jgi:hypothetical protein
MTRQVLRQRPLGACRDGPPIPLPRGQGRGQRCDALRGESRRQQRALRSLCAFIPLGLLLRWRPRRPAARLRGDRDPGRGAHAGLKRRQKIGALAVPTLRYDVPEGPYPFLPDPLQHRGRSLGLRLQWPCVGSLALDPPGGRQRTKPACRQEKPLLDEPLPLP